jgi:hypothetical protein
MHIGRHQTPGQSPIPRALVEQIDGWIQETGDIRQNLPAFGEQAANSYTYASFEEYFTEIAESLNRYINTDRDPFHPAINSSDKRMKAAKDAFAAARKAAKLFEGYSRKPHTYQRADSRISTSNLKDALTNLRRWLS